MVIFEKLHDDVTVPSRGTAGSAGYDLAAYLTGRTVTFWVDDVASPREVAVREGRAEIRLAPGEKALVPLGFKARLPAGVEAQVRPRSGASIKTGIVIANAPGTIDADYAEEWFVPVRNGGAATLVIRHGDRIAQAVFARFETPDLVPGEVRRTTERSGGFGSTG